MSTVLTYMVPSNFISWSKQSAIKLEYNLVSRVKNLTRKPSLRANNTCWCNFSIMMMKMEIIITTFKK